MTGGACDIELFNGEIHTRLKVTSKQSIATIRSYPTSRLSALVACLTGKGFTICCPSLEQNTLSKPWPTELDKCQVIEKVVELAC